MSLIRADARHLPLVDGCVQCVITSPPYWGLRDYGTAQWDGGDSACDHIEKRSARRDSPGGYHNSRNDRSGDRQPSTQATVMPFRDVCGKCGARRIDSQIGLESTPDEYVAQMVQVFREVKRVLRDDGTLWLNLGDSYASVAGSGRQGTTGALAGGVDGYVRSLANRQRGAAVIPEGLKPKDLCGIPWRVAFALQADGWYLRSDIIWSKPNPMPESVTDRPTKAHEYIFLLSKSASYYYDAEAIAEPLTAESLNNLRYTMQMRKGATPGRNDGGTLTNNGNTAGRNRRSVWHVATQPYPEAHFATYPEKLIEPCILAGTSEKGCCPSCLAPWVRVVERESSQPTSAPTSHRGVRLAADGKNGLAAEHIARGHARPPRNASSSATTVGWEPACACNAGTPIPCTVLDPFCGSGTTLAVAERFGRRAVGIDLSYQDLARKRTAQRGLRYDVPDDALECAEHDPAVAPLFGEDTA